MLKIKDLIQNIKTNDSQKVAELFQSIILNKTREHLKEIKPEFAKTLYKKEKITESVIQDLHDVVLNKTVKEIQLNNGEKFNLDLTTANALVTVYNAFKNEVSKQKFEEMISKDLKSFMKIVDFALKAVN